MADPDFCPVLGKTHTEARFPASYKFCPSCRSRIRPSTPVQDENEVICLESTPKKAMQVSQTRTHPRTAAEAARQQSIQRTSQLPIRASSKLSVLLMIYLVRYEIVDEDEWQRDKFLNSIPLHRAAIQPLNRAIATLDEFIQDSLLCQLSRIDLSKVSDNPPYLAQDVSKDSVTHLPKSAEDYRTIKDLLESGLFKKSQNSTIVYLVYDKFVDAVPDDDILDNPTDETSAKIKKEKKGKGKGKIKQEAAPLKQEEVPYKHKRGISQLSDAQRSRSPPDDATEQAPYELRSSTKR